jgi:uncharacterized protein (DUF1697 family)
VSRRVALLRSINVGGGGRLVMADLRACAARIGLADPRTIVQTGNLIFTPDRRVPAVVEAALETALAEDLGMTNAVMVRDATDWAALTAANPFPGAAADTPARLVLMLMKDRVSAGEATALAADNAGSERIAAGDRHLYIHYPDGVGSSKLTGAKIERRLRMLGTARNWNTVRKIADALAAD